jgi:signal transduction histidine kinase
MLADESAGKDLTTIFWHTERMPYSDLLTKVAWTLVVTLITGFIVKYVLHYYLNYDPKSFDPYWSRRGWLLFHVTGGTLALLVGPWQFWSGLRQTMPYVHRWTGRLFLIGVAIGVTGAAYLAVTTTFGWAFGISLSALTLAWVGTTATALYAIRKGAVSVHKEWMIRAYVVTFAFVTFHVLNEWLPTAQLQPEHDRFITNAWFCWVVPLFATVVIQTLASLRRDTSPRPRARTERTRAEGQIRVTHEAAVPPWRESHTTPASPGEFSAGIAREIRNPLDFVNNFADLSLELLQELKETAAPAIAELKEDKRGEIDEVLRMLTGNLAKIAEHGRRADSIVKSMLTHSRGNSSDPQSADTNALVEESLNLAYHAARAPEARSSWYHRT